MPGVRGFSGLMYLRAQHPGVPVVVVSANEDRGGHAPLHRFRRIGLHPQDDATSRRCAARSAQVLDGETWTPPDVDLGSPADPETSRYRAPAGDADAAAGARADDAVGGLLNKQIAYELSVSEATVKAHVSAILQKLGVESRTQAVIVAARIEAGPGKSGSEGAGPAKS